MIYCEIISFHGHKILWFEYDGHVRANLIYIVWILNLCIVLPIKDEKLNVQGIKMFSQ